jgi:hypothetical protein
MAALDLNISPLGFPDPEKAEKTTSSEVEKTTRSNKSSLGMLSPFTSKFKKTSSGDEPSIPRQFSPSDYKVFLILRDFLQPDSTVTLHDAVNRVLEVFPDQYHNLRPINGVCFELAEQVPYLHPSQHKLAAVLYSVGKNPRRIEKSRFKVRTHP